VAQLSVVGSKTLEKESSYSRRNEKACYVCLYPHLCQVLSWSQSTNLFKIYYAISLLKCPNFSMRLEIGTVNITNKVGEFVDSVE